jgi:multiple antibiotic resistance protein
MEFFFNTYIQMLFLLTPFFGVSIFLEMSVGLNSKERRWAAVRCALAILVFVFVFFFFGRPLFSMLGITLAAFQIGAGSTLFLTSMMMVLGTNRRLTQVSGDNDANDDFAVVPLALPMIVGPGTIGALMVWGTEIDGWVARSQASVAMAAAGLTMFVFLILAESIEKIMGRQLLAILTKITALILTALASQIIFTGVKHFLWAT